MSRHPSHIHLVKTALVSFASSLVWTSMIVYQLEVVGLNPLQLVLLGTVMEISIFLFEIPTGIVADLYSRRASAILGYGLLGLGFLVQGLIPTFEVLVLGNLIWGLGFTFTSGAYDAWLVDELGQAQAAQAMLRGGQVSRLAEVAALLAAILIGSINLQASILLGGVLVLLAALYLLLLMPETGFRPAASTERNSWRRFLATFREGLTLIRQRPHLLNIVGIGFIFGVFSEAFDRLWQAHLIQGVGLPFAQLEPIVYVSLIKLAVGLLGIAAAEAVRRRLRPHDGRQIARLFLGFTVLMVLGELAFALASGQFALALLALLVFSTSRSLNETLYGIWSHLHIDSQVRATVLSMQSQTDAIGQMVGGPPLGLLGLRSIPLALLASTGLLSLALPLIVRGNRLPLTQEQPA